MASMCTVLSSQPSKLRSQFASNNGGSGLGGTFVCRSAGGSWHLGQEASPICSFLRCRNGVPFSHVVHPHRHGGARRWPDLGPWLVAVI